MKISVIEGDILVDRNKEMVGDGKRHIKDSLIYLIECGCKRIPTK